jgi:hypothetical protein
LACLSYCIWLRYVPWLYLLFIAATHIYIIFCLLLQLPSLSYHRLVLDKDPVHSLFPCITTTKQNAFCHFVHYTTSVVHLVPPTLVLLILGFQHVSSSFAFQQGGSPPTIFHKPFLFDRAFCDWLKHSLFSRNIVCLKIPTTPYRRIISSFIERVVPQLQQKLQTISSQQGGIDEI